MRVPRPSSHLLKTSSPRLFLNGSEPTLADLQSLALVNYGHFTSLQYANGGVRGLDLHLKRLNEATQVLFGSDLPEHRVRTDLQQAVRGRMEAMVRINVFSRALSMRQLELEPAQAPDLLISLLPPPAASPTPLRVRSVCHQRYLPEIKSVGTFSLFHQRREARRAGFDDALFMDGEGRISEGSIWNVGFWDGRRLVWPAAPALPGISMQLLTQRFEAAGIPVETVDVRLHQLRGFRSAFFSNAAVALQPIGQIDDVAFAPDPEFYQLLDNAWSEVPWEPV